MRRPHGLPLKQIDAGATYIEDTLPNAERGNFSGHARQGTDIRSVKTVEPR